MQKQIRQMRDFWWEVCESKNTNPDLVQLNQKLDAILTQVEKNDTTRPKALENAKEALMEYHGRSGYNIKAATDFSGLSAATGITVPVSLFECPKCGGHMSPSREEKDAGGDFVFWYRCDGCSHEMPRLRGYKISL